MPSGWWVGVAGVAESSPSSSPRHPCRPIEYAWWNVSPDTPGLHPPAYPEDPVDPEAWTRSNNLCHYPIMHITLAVLLPLPSSPVPPLASEGPSLA